MEENKLIKYEGGLVQRVGDAISITNKLLDNSNCTFNFIGKNKKQIVVLIKDMNNEKIQDITLKYLTMILKACKLEIEDVAIINMFNNTRDITEVIKIFSAKVILSFGMDSSEINLPFRIISDEIETYNHCKILSSPSLNFIFEKGFPEKRKLWKSLKIIFDL